jgi:hypothetical protein
MEGDILDEEGNMKKAERQKGAVARQLCQIRDVWVLERMGGVA